MPKQEFVNHHNLDLLKVSLPFMNPRIQKSVEVLSKADEFINMMQSPIKSSDLSTMSLSSNQPDLEELLQQLKAVSSKHEQEMIDNMSNAIKMQKMFANYRAFMGTKQATASNSSASSQDTMMEFFLSQLTPEQRSNFENINVVLNAMNN
ncbi:MAG: hypothetical protein ACERKN_00355 [Velocimicrobium sp.]